MSHYQPLGVELLAVLALAPVLSYFAQSLLPRISLKFSISPRKTTAVIQLLYYLWILTALSELATQGVPPIFALGTNTYTEWGSQGLGGFMNAIALAVLPYFAFSKRLTARLSLFAVSSILLYQLITIRRGHLIFFICYLVLAHLFATRPRLSPGIIFRGFLVFCVLVIFFGIIGDSRGEYSNPFLRLFDPEYQTLLTIVPTGFVWALVYFTSPLSNFNSAWADPCADEFTPIFNLLPNPFKSSIVERFSLLDCSSELDNPALNVSTGFLTFKQSGLFAPAYLTLVVYAMASASNLYRKSNRRGLFSSSLMALCFMTILATFFSNFFFLPTYALGFGLLFLMASIGDVSFVQDYQTEGSLSR